MIDLSNAPYYDQTDKYKKDKKNYTQVLAVPGRVAQSREFNEMQSTLKDIIKSLGDSIMNDGNIIEGCQVVPNIATKTVRVTEGRVYIQGMVLYLSDTVLDMTAEGNEIVGVKLVESIVYASDDNTLRDPALGFENHNQVGCDRLRSELRVVVVKESELDSSIAVLAKLTDGEVSTSQQAPNYSALNVTLARRTYDESGSYIVNGLKVRVEPHQSDDSKFTIVVEEGKAYVHGYEINLNSSRSIHMNRSLQSVEIKSEHTYSEGSRYLLTTGPYTKRVLSVKGVRSSREETVNVANSSGGLLRYSTAFQILRVTKATGEVIDKTNYHLDQGGTQRYIRWNNTDYPGEVRVTYYYSHEFSAGDYESRLDTTDDNYYLYWLASSTVNPELDPDLDPVEGQSLYIVYEKYLARKDTVYLTEEGEVKAIEGLPADYGLEVAPSAPSYTLPLASVISPPGGIVDNTNDYQNINVSNVGLTRFTMSDIHKMLNRIRTIEYDQTVLSLNTEAKDYATDNKKGIFTDPFIDLSKIDMYFNLDSLGEVLLSDRPYYNSVVDLDSNMVYLPIISNFEDILYDQETSTISTYDKVATLKIKEGETKIVLSQDKATKSFLIAPYVSYPQVPEVSIFPSLDTWYDDKYVEVPVSINQSKVVSSSASTVNITKYDPSWHGADLYNTSTENSTQYSAVGTQVNKLVSEEVISEKAVTYIRSRDIEVNGSNYAPNTKNISCYFEGKRVNMTALGNTVGNSDGSVNANAKGSFRAKFTIPEKSILTGTRVVTFSSANKTEFYENSASTFYQGLGISRTIKRTITTINTVLKHRTDVTTVTKTYYDPLAQTFVLDSMTLLSGINIYFENVPEGNIPVTCEIREVQDGNIKSTVYGSKTLYADDIRGNISNDGSKATTFRFTDPVLIESNTEYAFVIRSTSTDYRVFVAEIGEKDYITKEMVVSNPYLQGVMMSSSNNSSWTVHQKTDVKFDLLSDTYNNTSEIYFEEFISEEGFCKLDLSAETILFDNTDIKWEYSIDGGNSYKSITPYNPQVLSSLANRILLRAKLSKGNTNLTPIIALDSVSFYVMRYDNSKDSYYVSKLISGLDAYNTVEIILDTYEPGGTNLEVSVSPSNSNAEIYNLVSATLSSSKELKNNWYEKTYTATLSQAATQCRIFVKFNSNNNYSTPAIRRLRAILS